MPIELYNGGGHRCLMFTDLCDEGGEAVQANQFLVVHGDTGAIIDPGGNLAYGELYLAMTKHFPPKDLSAILASHADPDIVASLDRWTTATTSKIYISTIWERFVPHFCKPGKTAGRVVGIPDAGMRIPIGKTELIAVPAHFLHSEGNFHFWDPRSRILFTGDLGASMGNGQDAQHIVTDFASHVGRMDAFHRRYMVSNKVLRLWVRMARTLPIEMIVPQHGSPMRGRAVADFLDWAENLPCGVDLMTEANYTLPA